MIIDGSNFDEKDLVGNEEKFLTKHGNIYISLEQINVLKKYNINVDNYETINDLIYCIEDFLNNSYEELEDLEWVSQTLSEYNYYNNVNK